MVKNISFKSFPGGSVVKNSPASAGDVGSLPGSGRSPGEGNGTHSTILAWRIPWTEEPGELQSTGSQRAGQDRAAPLHLGHSVLPSLALCITLHCIFRAQACGSGWWVGRGVRSELSLSFGHCQLCDLPWATPPQPVSVFSPVKRAERE